MALTDEDKQWILEQLHIQAQEFGERLEKVETTLLTEFHKWASPLEMRLRTHSMAIRTMDMEIESVSERLKKLEDDKH